VLVCWLVIISEPYYISVDLDTGVTLCVGLMVGYDLT